jgi:hypothetical protein
VVQELKALIRLKSKIDEPEQPGEEHQQEVEKVAEQQGVEEDAQEEAADEAESAPKRQLIRHVSAVSVLSSCEEQQATPVVRNMCTVLPFDQSHAELLAARLASQPPSVQQQRAVRSAKQKKKKPTAGKSDEAKGSQRKLPVKRKTSNVGREPDEAWTSCACMQAHADEIGRLPVWARPPVNAMGKHSYTLVDAASDVRITVLSRPQLLHRGLPGCVRLRCIAQPH